MGDLVIAGGTEMMSLTGTMAAQNRGAGLPPALMGAHNEHLEEIHPQTHQGISREALDALGLESQKRAKIAMDEGRVDKSILPVHNLDGSLALDHDEYPRPNTTAEPLANLKLAFTALADAPYDEEGHRTCLIAWSVTCSRLVNRSCGSHRRR